MVDSVEKEEVKLEDICLDARSIKIRRGYVILCASNNPDAGIAPQIPVPVLKKGDVCVASDFFNTGHSNPDCNVDMNNMYDCPYRRNS